MVRAHPDISVAFFPVCLKKQCYYEAWNCTCIVWYAMWCKAWHHTVSLCLITVYRTSSCHTAKRCIVSSHIMLWWSHVASRCVKLYHIALCAMVSCRVVLHCIMLYCSVSYCIVLCCIVLWCILSCRISHITSYCITLCHVSLFHFLYLYSSILRWCMVACLVI